MPTLIKTKGIVLHEMPIKEQDKRIILFSREYGKMVVFANGAKRAKSSLLAGTQPFVFGEFHVYEGKNSYTLKQVEVIESFYSLREDLKCLYYGLYLLEVCNQVIQEMDPNDELLRLLYISLITLKNKTQEPEVIRRIFEFRALSTLGFQPDLQEEKSGASEEVLTILHFLQDVKIGRLYHFKIEPERFNEVASIIHRFFSYYIDGDYKSLAFIDLLDD